MNNVNAVLFDLDGTLIDSEYFYFSNWAPILENDYGLKIDFDEWISNFAGHTPK
jgi:beta-phosphoglucomutase